MAKSTFPVELGLSDIQIKRVEVDRCGDYHIHVSCTVRQTRCASCGKAISKSHGYCKASVIEHLLGCLNRLLSVDQFLDSRCQSRLSSAWRPRIFKEVKSALITVRATWVPSGLPLGSPWWTERRWR